MHSGQQPTAAACWAGEPGMAMAAHEHMEASEEGPSYMGRAICLEPIRAYN